MNLKVLARGTAEPVTLAEAKLHLRVDVTDDDVLIGAMISAARDMVERYTSRTLIYTAYRMTMDMWTWDIELPRSPAVEAAANLVTGISYVTPRIRYYDNDYVQQTITYADDDFELLLDNNPPLLVLPPSTIWPITAPLQRGAIEIDWIAGYGAGSTGIPQLLRLAIMMLVAHWYEHREAVGSFGSEVPLAVDSVLRLYSDGGYS
jgi:uncharacterized phiE125 gp8 family phage protein